MFPVAAYSAELVLEPDNTRVQSGEVIRVSLQVADLSGEAVGALDVIVSWDGAVLQLDNAELGGGFEVCRIIECGNTRRGFGKLCRI